MKPFGLTSLFLFLSLIVSHFANAETSLTGLKVIHPEAREFSPGPKEYFIGDVKVARLVQGESPSNLGCGQVEFSKGARSNWHTHPRGQLLIVTSGSGLVQEWEKPIHKVKNGAVIWTPPGVKHWHGASPSSAMGHFAITESAEGMAVNWLERVTDEQYLREAK